MERREESLLPSSFEIQLGKIYSVSRPGNNTLLLLALRSEAPLSELKTLPLESSFLFQERWCISAPEYFYQPVSCL